MEEREKSNNDITEKKIKKQSQKDMYGVMGGFVSGILYAFFSYKIFINLVEFKIGQILAYIIGFFAFIFLMVAVSCFFDYKRSKKIEDLDEEAHREEKELSEISLEKRALEAEKMFRMNQKELMRYYDMNLAQTKFLSVLGIMMIIFGILIVAASLFMYMSMDADKVLLLVGSLSGIVVDFIGAIFIKMYTKNIEAAVKFHAKFAESNNLLLANSIANKIEDEKIREDTLTEIFKSIFVAKEVENYIYLCEKIENKDYQKRIRNSFEYYIRNANFYKYFGMTLSILGIILPALATALTACEKYKNYIAWVTFAATVASGILAFFKCADKQETYRKAAENMKAELVAYATEQGAYKDYGTESFDKDEILFKRIESIIQNGYDKIAELNKERDKSGN